MCSFTPNGKNFLILLTCFQFGFQKQNLNVITGSIFRHLTFTKLTANKMDKKWHVNITSSMLVRARFIWLYRLKNKIKSSMVSRTTLVMMAKWTLGLFAKNVCHLPTALHSCGESVRPSCSLGITESQVGVCVAETAVSLALIIIIIISIYFMCTSDHAQSNHPNPQAGPLLWLLKLTLPLQWKHGH